MDFFDVHTHSFSLDKNVFSILNTYPNSLDFTQPFSIGIHPWYLTIDKIEEELVFVENKLQGKNCFALGECGLDKLIAVDFELQREVFKKQIQISEKYKKPLIIHCVKAYQEIIEIKKEVKPTQVWILHGFNKNKQLAESFLKNGIILSFGSAIIKNKKLQEVFLELPISSLLLETDASDIEIQEIYQKASEIKNSSLKDLQAAIHQNFKRIFIQ
ncbi:TatD family hydrolase [Polaribacter glomeratus]|uniref:Hydrolase TatD n=1 Tax=Polaribacter glomeratus TaxID=102 RepID=A0A2S7WYV0_9FLAO|nr:TatD family hydrolase [Polaribacter glomeratus]PQJ82760.1 hydrolase TatD [Polaribacter glomeratus]TXD65304.1 TatD family deoxyribonuclease [Polaribacter glomeratus]